MSDNEKKPAAREVARKITIATASGGPSKWFDKLVKMQPNEAGEKSLDLCRIYGLAAGYTAGATEFGEFIKLAGSFRGVNLDTGEVSDAPQVILPTFLANAFRAALDAPERNGPVQFAFLVRAVYDVTAATKYRYAIIDLMPPAVNDPLAAIEGAMLGISAAQQAQIEHDVQPEDVKKSAPAAKSKGK